jgi:hypothetical protein
MQMNEAEVQAVLGALRALRAPAMSEEYDIHRMIGAALTEHGLEYSHEFSLGPRCRIDFAVGRIGVEVKKGRPDRRRLLKQLERYLSGGKLDAVIVVCGRAVSLPPTLQGRPVTVLSLNRLWGVALP